MSYVFNPYERSSFANSTQGLQNKRKSQEYSRTKQIYGENETKLQQPKLQFKSQSKQQPPNQFARTFHPGQQQPRVFTQQNALLSRYQPQQMRPVSQQQSKVLQTLANLIKQKMPFQLEQDKMIWNDIQNYVSDDSEGERQNDMQYDDECFQKQFQQIKKQPCYIPQYVNNQTNLDNLSNQSLSGESKRNSFNNLNNSKKSSTDNLQNNRSVFQKREENQDPEVLMVVRKNTAAVVRPMTSEGVRRKKMNNLFTQSKNDEVRTEQNDERGNGKQELSNAHKVKESHKIQELEPSLIEEIQIYDDADLFGGYANNCSNDKTSQYQRDSRMQQRNKHENGYDQQSQDIKIKHNTSTNMAKHSNTAQVWVPFQTSLGQDFLRLFANHQFSSH